MGFADQIFAAALRRAAHLDLDRRPDLFLTVKINREAANNVCEAVIELHIVTCVSRNLVEKHLKAIFQNNFRLTHHRAGRGE
jgi:hypothetical protein